MIPALVQARPQVGVFGDREALLLRPFGDVDFQDAEGLLVALNGRQKGNRLAAKKMVAITVMVGKRLEFSER